MAKVELLKVFLASPGDVANERQVVKDVLDTVNRTIGLEKEIRLELVGWDTDSYPAYGGDAQSIINNQIADMTQYDLFIGIMWNRFGTPTPRAGSGTEEEFRMSVESFKKKGQPAIMFYFNQQPFNPSNAAEAAQKLKVLTFKEEVEKDSLAATYNGLEEFRGLFHRHVEQWLIQYNLNTLKVPHVEATTVETGSERAVETSVKPQQAPLVVSNSGMWVLLNNGFSVASQVNELGDNKISMKVPVTEASEDATFRSLKPSQYGRAELIPFAHQNIAGIAKVIDATRTSAGDSAVWELIIQLENLNSGFGMEMAYGNISANQLAAMRARYLLLNEKPVRPERRNQNILADAELASFVQGIRTNVKVKGSFLPRMWEEMKGDITTFLPIARLWSVFHLITSNTCEHILDLTLGPITDGIMHVRFRGQRRKEYANQDPYIIEFEGDCDLNAE